MSGPFIFIATNRLKPSKFDAERARVRELAAFIESHEPRLLAFNEYANEERSEVSVVQVHPDIESMLFHMEVVREQAERAYVETLEATVRVKVLGTVTEEFLSGLRFGAGRDVALDIWPYHVGGFTRLR